MITSFVYWSIIVAASFLLWWAVDTVGSGLEHWWRRGGPARRTQIAGMLWVGLYAGLTVGGLLFVAWDWWTRRGGP